jgi:hypothetical protein
MNPIYNSTIARSTVTRLIFIGDHFYSQSGSMMSSIYTEDGYRYDWGFVQRDLRDGREVHIRPANPIELAHYESKLAEYKARHAEETG